MKKYTSLSHSGYDCKYTHLLRQTKRLTGNGFRIKSEKKQSELSPRRFLSGESPRRFLSGESPRRLLSGESPRRFLSGDTINQALVLRKIYNQIGFSIAPYSYTNRR